MIIDTQCHYNLEPLFADWKSHWQKAQENDVAASIVIGTDAETSHRGIEIASSEPTLWASVGVHPNTYEEQPDSEVHQDIANIEKLLPHPKVLAIGETGLDYFHLSKDTSLSDADKERIKHKQREAFRCHITLAEKHHLPLIIHSRDITDAAYTDILTILTESRKQQFSQPFILHCVSGPTSYVQKAIELGGYIGVAGNVTYKNAEHLRDLVRSVPKDRILLETDAPFLPPQQFRGKTCEPWMIRHTAEFVTTEFHISLDEIRENTYRLFPAIHIQ